VPVPVILFFFAMMLPTPFGLEVGDLRVSAYRIVLIIMILPMIGMMLIGRRAKITVFDTIAVGHAAWAVVALILWGGMSAGVEAGGIYAVEFLGAYLLGRIYVRTAEDFHAFATALVWVTVGMLVFTVPESLTGLHFMHDGVARVFGGPLAHHIEPRMGIERAFGPFDHPILYGVFAASAFSSAYFVVAQERLLSWKSALALIGVGTATFLSASSGPYVVIAVQMFAIGWLRVLKGVAYRWRAMFAMFVVWYVVIDVFSNRTPFHLIVSYLTFSPASAYNRINIWIYGTAEVARYPVFGIGLGDWVRAPWMSDSMDNFWLVIAVRYGLPALVLLVALLVGLVMTIGMRRNLPIQWRQARHAWAFALFGISVGAGTVHLWNAMFVLFVFFIGAGVWMYDTTPPKPSRKTLPDGRTTPSDVRRRTRVDHGTLF
jgi:hypothetical protein